MSLLVLCLCIALAGCRQRPPAPAPHGNPAGESVTLIDQADRQVTLPERPGRIVSLAPSVTETLFALGAGDRVVGVTTACNYPPEAQEREQVGGFQMSVEKIISLEPDLVIGVSTMQKGTLDALDRAGVPLLVVYPNTFDDLYTAIGLMGRAVGAESQAQAMVEDIQAVRRRIRDAAAVVPENERPRAFIEIGDQPLRTAGPGTFVSQIVEDAGGRNIAADVRTDWSTFSYEAVIARNPDVIITTIPGDVDRILQLESWSSVRAIRDKRVHALDPDLVVRPGPRLKDGLEAVFEVLHPSGAT